MKMRLQNAIYNSASALILFVLKLVMQFVNRTLFIKFLGIYYLGLNGVFSNILGMLALAELGLGTSIVYALYKPIAENKKEKIVAYMNLYKKVYKFIAIVILLLGLAVYPFLPSVLQVSSLSFEENTIYFLFLMNSIMGYLLFSYKRSLFIARQENYIVSWLDFSLYTVLSICQWLVMIFFRSYVLVLVLTICATVISNLLIAFLANKRYPLKNVKADVLTKSEKKSLKKNVLGNLVGNIAGFVVFSTDNILISSFISVTTVGLYSNYVIITNAFTKLISQIMESQTASVGNLIQTSSSDKVYEVFKRYQFANFVISYMVSVLIFLLMNPFINLWLGSDFLFSQRIVLILSIYFFIQAYRYSGFILYGGYGLYWESRYKPVAEAILNLLLSLLYLLYFKMGIEGILLGTICSTLLTNTWFEPYVIFKYGLKMSIKEYALLNFKHWAVFFITIFLLYSLLPQGLNLDNLLSWILHAVSFAIVFSLLILFIFCKDKALKWWLNFVSKRLVKKR
ncbi:lipopolysaccharide biosynthesis protein [Streptococcus sp. ZJ93]|uniref:lipopolysaccharide biosynthesis protein n=1 Tax=Streptococcus handemini TaxID=3161188 RepID=UPI0032EBD2D7